MFDPSWTPKGSVGEKDITDCIEAYAAIYEDGEVAGVYRTEQQAERAHMGEGCIFVRMVPADTVIIG